MIHSFLCFTPRFPIVTADGRENLLDVAFLDGWIDSDIIRMQDLGVVDGCEYGLLECLWEERIFIGRLVTTKHRVETLTLEEQPVHQAQI